MAMSKQLPQSSFKYKWIDNDKAKTFLGIFQWSEKDLRDLDNNAGSFKDINTVKKACFIYRDKEFTSPQPQLVKHLLIS